MGEGVEIKDQSILSRRPFSFSPYTGARPSSALRTLQKVSEGGGKGREGLRFLEHSDSDSTGWCTCISRSPLNSWSVFTIINHRA